MTPWGPTLAPHSASSSAPSWSSSGRAPSRGPRINHLLDGLPERTLPGTVVLTVLGRLEEKGLVVAYGAVGCIATARSTAGPSTWRSPCISGAAIKSTGAPCSSDSVGGVDATDAAHLRRLLEPPGGRAPRDPLSPSRSPRLLLCWLCRSPCSSPKPRGRAAPRLTALVGWQAIALAGGLAMVGAPLVAGLAPLGSNLPGAGAALAEGVRSRTGS